MQLVIGNKNYSTWSLRPWLLMDAHQLAFDEICESLANTGLSERLRRYSASCRVPVLIDDDLVIWDSMAICEYLSEHYLGGNGWHQATEARAIARAISAEMHSGFNALRNEMPMNCRALRKVDLSLKARQDIARIDAIWSDYAKADEQGNMRLLGQFSIADCFFAPVVFRFKTYSVELSSVAQNYADSLYQHPSMQRWLAAALTETEIVEEDEAGAEVDL